MNDLAPARDAVALIRSLCITGDQPGIVAMVIAMDAEEVCTLVGVLAGMVEEALATEPQPLADYLDRVLDTCQQAANPEGNQP